MQINYKRQNSEETVSLEQLKQELAELKKAKEKKAQSKRYPSGTKKQNKPSKKLGRHKVAFEKTELGAIIKYMAPLEFSLLMQVYGPYCHNANIVEAVGYASTNPLFKTETFRRALIEFQSTGLYPVQPYEHTVEKELEYAKFRVANHISNVCTF